MPARDHLDEMVSRYKRGETLEQIGSRFGVTRERVRQLVKQAGITRKDGGISRRSSMQRAINRAAAIARKNARYLAKFGDTAEVVLLLNGGSVKQGTLAVSYFEQKRNAAVRGIGWEFTFSTWVAVWHASGHMSERGRGVSRYVMARHGDVGPYSPSNVYITTAVENVLDYHRARRARGEPHNCGKPSRGWHWNKSNPRSPYQVRIGSRYVGCFRTEEAALAAYRAAVGATPNP